MKDFSQTDNLLRSYFDTERSKNISMPSGIEERIMERIYNRSSDSAYENKALVWSCVGVIAATIIGLGFFFNYTGFFDFSSISDMVSSIALPEISFPKVDISSTPMGSLWFTIGIFATGLMICSLYLSRRLHSNQ